MEYKNARLFISYNLKNNYFLTMIDIPIIIIEVYLKN